MTSGLVSLHPGPSRPYREMCSQGASQHGWQQHTWSQVNYTPYSRDRGEARDTVTLNVHPEHLIST